GTQGGDQSVNVTSTGGSIQLDNVAGQQDVAINGETGVNTGTVTSTRASVLLNSNAGNVVADTTIAAGDVTMTAPVGTITAQSTTARGGNVTLRAGGDVDAGTV